MAGIDLKHQPNITCNEIGKVFFFNQNNIYIIEFYVFQTSVVPLLIYMYAYSNCIL